jgi:RHS repeat-associated protein
MNYVLVPRYNETLKLIQHWSRISLLLAALCTSSIAQTSTSVIDGSTPLGLASGSPAGSLELSDFENVYPFNGNLGFSLPLYTIGGRGSIQHAIRLNIGTKWHVIDTITPPPPPPPGDQEEPRHTYNPSESPVGPPYPYDFSPGYMYGRRAGKGPIQICGQTEVGGYFQETLTRLTFVGTDGTELEFRDQLTGGRPASVTTPCANAGASRGTVFTTADGASATFVSDELIFDHTQISDSITVSGYLMFKDGTRYRIESGRVAWICDRNGNKINYHYGLSEMIATDSLNRQVIITRKNNNTPYDQITYKGTGGVSRTIRVWYSNMSDALRSGYSIQTYRDLFSSTDTENNDYYNPSVVSSVELPDGRRYRFYYNNYGELARVELPTGGAVEYDYMAGIVNGSVEGVFTVPLYGYAIYRRVVERRVYIDGSSLTHKTIYSRPEQTQFNGVEYVDVTRYDAGGVQLFRERHYYYGTASGSFSQGPTEYPGWRYGKEYKVEFINSSGATLNRITQTWQQRAPVSWWTSPNPDAEPANDPRIIETVTELSDVTPSTVTKTTFNYDQYNNPTDILVYGFGQGAPGPLIRHTKTTYLSNNPNQGDVNYAANVNIHIRNLPTNVVVFDATGKKVAETDYAYDAYGTEGFPGLQDCPLITQHDPAFHHNYGTRGNLVQISKVINFSPDSTPSGYIKNNFQYDLAGNMVKKIDGRGNVTLIDYTDRFGAPDGDAESNNVPPELGNQFSYAYPSSVADEQLRLITRTQYDYYTGKPVDIEDQNNVTGSIYYDDALDRPTKNIKAVGTSFAGHTRYIYNDNAIAVDGNPAHSITTISDKNSIGESDSGNGLKSIAFYDGLGRTLRKAVYEGNTGEDNTWLVTDTQFDALGRISKVSNPYRLNAPDGASATSEWTATEYDARSRVIRVTTPDGAHVDMVYAGNQVTVTDQAGKKRRSETDALGRLTKVTEDPSGLNYGTTYLYDALDNLRLVNQGTQKRWFAYDALSRLIRARNPEQDINSNLPAYTDPVTGGNGWSTAYTYDANGNLVSKTDARNITTTYTYDPLNRNTKIEYSSYANGSSIVERYYDNEANYGKGRLWYEIAYNKRWEKATDNLAYHQSTVKYDPLGRPNSLSQGFQVLVAGSWQYKTFTFLRTYDLAGNVIAQDYPSSRGVTYTYDSAGRLKSFSGTIGDLVDRNYASDVRYNNYGLMSRGTYGTQTPLYQNMHYNNRLQMVDLRLGANPNDENDWSHGALSYYYGTNAKNTDDPFANSADNNGNVLRHVNTVPLAGGGQVIPQMDDYSYDALNRITSVSEQQQNQDGTRNTVFTQGFSYDQWGNRAINLGATTIGIPGVTRRSFVSDTGTNRLTSVDGMGMTYDTAGNQTNDANGDRYYDNENRMTKVVQGGQTHYYFYDAIGKRVRRILNGSQTSGGQETWFVYGFDGELLEEYAYNQVNPPSATTPVKEYGYQNGKLLVVWDGAQSGDKRLKWLVTDHLGSTRMELDKSGSLAGVGRIDWLPFGEQLTTGAGIRSASIGYGADSVRQKFVGYERDDETGLDFAQSRYYASIQGRFCSPDSYNIIFEKEKGRDEKEQAQFFTNYISQPQNWNKYTYTLNNPLALTDPDGRRPISSDDVLRLSRLYDEYLRAQKAKDTTLANAIKGAIREIAEAILKVPEGASDPVGLKVIFYAIDNLGNTNYGKAGTVSNGVTTDIGPGENKCNIFCANSYAIGGGIGFGGTGVPINSSFLGGLIGRQYPPVANDYANSSKTIPHFDVVTIPQLGDIAAFPARIGQGHSSIYTGNGTVIYAAERTVKVQTVNYVLSAGGHSSVTYRRYKP